MKGREILQGRLLYSGDGINLRRNKTKTQAISLEETQINSFNSWLFLQCPKGIFIHKQAFEKDKDRIRWGIKRKKRVGF